MKIDKAHPARLPFSWSPAQYPVAWRLRALDKDGFVLTGADISDKWQADRPPYYLETSRPRIFSAGDVRSGSVKRVAAAVGEDAAAIQAVHQYLARREGRL